MISGGSSFSLLLKSLRTTRTESLLISGGKEVILLLLKLTLVKEVISPIPGVC